MRLSPREIQIIKAAIHQSDPEADIYLFGSRSDPQKKGGDIDLLIFSQILGTKDKIVILNRIFENIEEQKIDILITKDAQDPFVQLALEKTVKL